MVRSFCEVAELCLSLGGEISFEWPRDCTGWCLEPLAALTHRHQLLFADVDGCVFLCLAQNDSQNDTQDGWSDW